MDANEILISSRLESNHRRSHLSLLASHFSREAMNCDVTAADSSAGSRASVIPLTTGQRALIREATPATHLWRARAPADGTAHAN